jgi:hypothetical protein
LIPSVDVAVMCAPEVAVVMSIAVRLAAAR